MNNPHIVCLQMTSRDEWLFTKAFPLFERFGVLSLVEGRHAVTAPSTRPVLTTSHPAKLKPAVTLEEIK